MVLQQLADACFNRPVSKSMPVEYFCGGMISIIQDGKQQMFRLNQRLLPGRGR